MLQQKRGDTFRLDCTVKIDGNPVDITDWAIASELRSGADALLQTLTITKTNAAAGQYRIAADMDATALWPPGMARMDIEYTYPSDGDFRVSSETLDVKILKDVTRGEA